MIFINIVIVINIIQKKIECECFSTLEDAIKSYQTRNTTKKNVWYRLVCVNKLFPKFINNSIIKYEFGYGLINGVVSVNIDDKIN